MTAQRENPPDSFVGREAKSGRPPKHPNQAQTHATHVDPHKATNNAGWFTWFAHETAQLTGRPATFIVATGIIAIWAISGPLFHFSDTWQLVINTGTTIVTFLMVFLIQNTQNRDSLAFQIKLAELIIAVRGAHNQVAAAEDMSDKDLEALHAAYRKRAEETLDRLKSRHGSDSD